MADILGALISKNIEDNMSRAQKVMDTPNKANEVQFPKQISSHTLQISSVPFDKSCFPTIIIATQTAGYTGDQFTTDVEKVTAFFNLSENQIIKILLKPIMAVNLPTQPNTVDLSDVLDSADAANQLEKAVVLVRKGMPAPQLSDQPNPNMTTLYQTYTRVQMLSRLRIVSLGVKFSQFFFQALEYLLNQWESPAKSVQFVTNGETENYLKLRFWKTACINNLVGKVDFVNLSDYLPFGYYDDGKGIKLTAVAAVDTADETTASSQSSAVAVASRQPPAPQARN